MPYVNDAERIGHLCEADWSTKNLVEEDNEVEVDQLESNLEQEDQPGYGSDQLVKITEKDHAASATALTFINESFTFNPFQKRKQESKPDLASADEDLPGPAVKKFISNRFIPQGITDVQVNQILGGKQKKYTGKGKVRRDTSDGGNPSEDDEGDPPRRFTVYVQVWAETPAEKKPGKTSKTPTITFISKGPFKMDMSKSFETFKREVMEVLPCRTSMLPVVKFKWKFDNQAQSAPCKKIANRAGYEALIDAINAKQVANNVVVWLYAPKPAKDDEGSNPDYVEEPFDFDQEAIIGPHKSFISDMATKRRLAEEELEKEYPLGRLAPPLSVHFADEKKLKVLSRVPPPLNALPATFGQYYRQCQEEATFGNQALALPVPPQAAPPPFPVPGGFPPLSHPYAYQPYFAPPYMQAPHIGGYPYLPRYSPAPHHQPVTDPGEILSASSSPSITTSHDVSLSEFCAKYRISDSDQAKLAALEYRPGNRAVETLEEKEWRDVVFPQCAQEILYSNKVRYLDVMIHCQPLQKILLDT
ncbi:hypothetical protein BDR04DRAFT_1118414 [Suillus decipiens]|nr:hypothetical protein BDR04DRAFT_1118414 [Suillus decipiens]